MTFHEFLRLHPLMSSIHNHKEVVQDGMDFHDGVEDLSCSVKTPKVGNRNHGRKSATKYGA